MHLLYCNDSKFLHGKGDDWEPLASNFGAEGMKTQSKLHHLDTMVVKRYSFLDENDFCCRIILKKGHHFRREIVSSFEVLYTNIRADIMKKLWKWVHFETNIRKVTVL